MILQELNNYYLRLRDNRTPGIPERYWSIEKVAWEFTIDTCGRLIAITPLTQGDENNLIDFVMMKVPEHDGRTSGIHPFFLCDRAAYLLGLDEKHGAEQFAAAKELHETVLGNCEDIAAKAVLSFFHSLETNLQLIIELQDKPMKDGFVVFFLQEENDYIHERTEIKNAWEKFCDSKNSAAVGQCSVTGKQTSIARLFPTVRGIFGAQKSGASLVSFNNESFESYEKSQSYNASISEDVSFNSGAALRFLLNDKSHSTRIGSTTIVFWSDRSSDIEDNVVARFFDLNTFQENEPEDSLTTLKVKAALESIQRGIKPGNLNHDTKYFILGLAPNNARLAVRFFEICTFGEIEDSFGTYLQDIEMIGVGSTSLYAFLCQAAPLGKSKDIPSTLISATVNAMLTGKAFPQSLYHTLLSRMRADHAQLKRGGNMGLRAAMMKAYLVRRTRILDKTENREERGLTVALDIENTQPGYLLGRLFAVMEKAQQDAIKGINTTISDRYLGAAATTPQRIYPYLMRLAQTHISALKKRGGGIYLDRWMTEIASLMNSNNPYPRTLDNLEQGLFYIGYYQQKEALWSKSSKERTEITDSSINYKIKED